MDNDSLAVLEALQQLMNDGGSERYFDAAVIARELGFTPDAVLDELDILADEGAVDIKHHPAGIRAGSMATLTTRGAAIMARSRKRSRGSSGGAEEIVVRSFEEDYPYDVFVSYAGEDRGYVTKLLERLDEEKVSYWYDRDRVMWGEPLLSAIQKGLTQSRFAILILTQMYFEKSYPRAELEALLKRQIEERKVVVLPLLCDVPREKLQSLSPFLATLNYFPADDLDLVMTQLLRHLRPAMVSTATPTMPSSEGSAGTSSREANIASEAAATFAKALAERDRPFGMPYDALEDDVRLMAFRPRLNILVAATRRIEPTNIEIDLVVENVGPGAASKVRAFLPGLTTLEAPVTIAANGGRYVRTVPLSKRSGHYEPMGVIAQVIVEFEDVAGNLFRQYGRPNQPSIDGLTRRFGYEVEELARPYLVPRRIVEPDPGDRRFSRTPALSGLVGRL